MGFLSLLGGLGARFWITVALAVACGGVGALIGARAESLVAASKEAQLTAKIAGMAADYAQQKAEAAAKLQLEQARVLAVERQMSAQVVDFESKYLEAQKGEKIALDSLHAALHSGTYRVSIPVATCSSVPASAGSGSASASGSGAEARAQLLPATVDGLVGLAGECDADVRQLNSLIDLYNAVRDRVNSAGVTK